jgi:hypothetical protein
VLVALQVVALVLVALVLSSTLAHAMELPGKMRLAKEAYLATQQIYYPGFTIAGGAEPAGLLVLLILAVIVAGTGAGFWLTLAALPALAAAHGIYWLVTHPVNNFWLKDFELKGAGKGFFALGSRGLDNADWKALRDRWEYSHLARAALGLIAFICLATAVAID